MLVGAAVVMYDGGARLGCGGYASRSSRWNARTASEKVPSSGQLLRVLPSLSEVACTWPRSVSASATVSPSVMENVYHRH